MTNPVNPQKQLYLAVVEHRVVPGARIKLLYQEKPPTEQEVVQHYAFALDDDESPEKHLKVTNLFDISSQLEQAGNLEQLQAALADFANRGEA